MVTAPRSGETPAEDPPDPPRAADIAEASSYIDGLLRWSDIGPRAREIVADWGEAPAEDTVAGR